MSQTAVYILWAAAILVFAVLEGLTVQLVSIWFVLGSVAALIAALCGASFTVQVVLFAAVSVISLLLTRPFVKKWLKIKAESTNADRCIGARAVVTETIDNLAATGQVKVQGAVWSARSASGAVVETGQTVTVKRIEGVKLIVE
ncbi:MAG: NfeD family protein [Clostridia bacterium]|nr:NfeD family protein [Clostridia bacterium]